MGRNMKVEKYIDVNNIYKLFPMFSNEHECRICRNLLAEPIDIHQHYYTLSLIIALTC